MRVVVPPDRCRFGRGRTRPFLDLHPPIEFPDSNETQAKRACGSVGCWSTQASTPAAGGWRRMFRSLTTTNASVRGPRSPFLALSAPMWSVPACVSVPASASASACPRFQASRLSKWPYTADDVVSSTATMSLAVTRNRVLCLTPGRGIKRLHITHGHGRDGITA